MVSHAPCLPVPSLERRLPVVLAEDTGTIPFGYGNGCCNRAHSYNHNLTNADSSRRAGPAGNDCPIYFVNSWALGWSRDPLSSMWPTIQNIPACIGLY